MRPAYTVAMSVLCMGTAISCSCRKAASNQYSQDIECPIVFDETEVHVGSVYAESLPYEGSFFFTNRSRQTIELTAQACCGGEVEFADDRKVYGPGERGELVFRVTGVGTRSGLCRKKTTVFQKAGKRAVAILVLAADIKRKARISPTHLKFGQVRPGQTLTAKLVVASGTEEPLTITGVITSLPGLLNVTYATEVDRSGLPIYLCEVSLTGDGKERSINEVVSFKTNCADIDKIPVHVLADMMGPVILKPQSLFFGKVLPGVNVLKSLYIASTCEEVLAVRSVSCTPNNVRLAEVAPSNNHGIDLALLFRSPSDVSGVVRGSLTIVITRTVKDSEEATECTVPWMALVDPND